MGRQAPRSGGTFTSQPNFDVEKHSHWQIDVETRPAVSLDDPRIARAIKACGL